jgi:hypothetical protein
MNAARPSPDTFPHPRNDGFTCAPARDGVVGQISSPLTGKLALTPVKSQVLGVTARVVAIHADGAELDDGRRATSALSCLLQPQIGDQVLVADDPTLILAILQREAGQTAELHVPGARALRLCQREIAIEASEGLALRSLRDAELSAVTGTLRLAARNLFTTVLETLVERAADHLAKVGSFALDVSTLLRIRSRHGIVTAEQQMRIDAEQLHLG